MMPAPADKASVATLAISLLMLPVAVATLTITSSAIAPPALLADDVKKVCIVSVEERSSLEVVGSKAALIINSASARVAEVAPVISSPTPAPASMAAA